jgi:hypothetical protein
MPDTPKNENKAGAGKSRERLRAQVRTFGALAAMFGRKGLVGGTRLVLPLIEGYAQSRDPSKPDITKGGKLNFSADEVKVLKSAGAKLAYELIECSSKVYPVMEDVEPYKAQKDPETNLYPAPKLCQILSLFRAGQGILGPWIQKKPEPQAIDQFNLAAQKTDTTARPVLLTAVAPGVYAPFEGPFTPLQIRRSAMSQQLYYTKQQQTMASGTSAVSAVESRTVESSCCCGTHPSASSMARYEETGECADLFSISCETQWRIRNCFKEMLCDILYCIGSNMCEDGHFNDDADLGDILGDCFETALCSLVRCLPDAICGPRPPICDKPKPSIECNFAVEEVD